MSLSNPTPSAPVIDALMATMRATVERAYQAGRHDGVADLVASVTARPPVKPRRTRKVSEASLDDRMALVLGEIRSRSTTTRQDLLAAFPQFPGYTIDLLTTRLVAAGAVVRIMPGVYAAAAEG